ncbi:MAG: ribosome small subunit-dependent GTPase A [Ferrovum sp.]|nr:ribosome small subunit-dependent GTPase A [Ferrovum sp.]
MILNDIFSGIVTSAHGRHYMVLTNEQHLNLICTRPSKKIDVVCGDLVNGVIVSENQGIIKKIHARSSFLFREDLHRQKAIAANVDRILVVISPNPPFNDQLLAHCLVSIEANKIQPIIICNKKKSLPQAPESLNKTLEYYESLDYPIVYTEATEGDLGQLPDLIQDHNCLLLGQSGMGKSTITNQLIPGASARTKEISTALQSGKHTTTSSQLYFLPQGGTLIDSPGLQTFGLHHLSENQITRQFREFKNLVNHCRYRNCSHTVEAGCQLKEASLNHPYMERRLEILVQLCRQQRQALLSFVKTKT